MFRTASRLEGINEYYFSKKLREIESLNQAGKNIINLGIGSPDLPPHPEVIETLRKEAARPDVHAYQSYKGSPVFRKAVSEWYRKWYRVSLDAETEILPLMGSKEGIMHICMTYLNEGDLVLVPNPGYPTYRSAATMAGGWVVNYDLTGENGWLPDFGQLKNIIQSREGSAGSGNANVEGKPKQVLMFVNYPQMPTGRLPTMEMFERLVEFAREHNVLLVHDNPYSFILNDHPLSLLEVPGAMEVAMELNSLSKSHNMAGWRVGVLCASAQRINEVLCFKSNMDSGMFLPLQLAAARALQLPESWYSSLNEVYARRRDLATRLLSAIGCSYDPSQAGMFIWARIPDTYPDGYALSDRVLYEAGVFLTPGGIFGNAGDRYLRISLCSKDEKFNEALGRIMNWKNNLPEAAARVSAGNA